MRDFDVESGLFGMGSYAMTRRPGNPNRSTNVQLLCLCGHRSRVYHKGVISDERRPMLIPSPLRIGMGPLCANVLCSRLCLVIGTLQILLF